MLEENRVYSELNGFQSVLGIIWFQVTEAT